MSPNFSGSPKGFFIGEIMTVERTNNKIELAKTRLLSTWLENVNCQSLTPIVNFDKTVNLFHQAQSSGQILAFIAIGCADWVDWSNSSEKIWHVGKIEATNKRLNRFAHAVLAFQQALLSFGVNSTINISLSNVEMHDERPQGLDGRFDDLTLAKENISLSNKMMMNKFSELGINCTFFDHWQLVTQLGFVTQKQFSAYLDFIKDLYSFDLSCTGHALVGPGQLGPVWLDIQSFSFPELIITLRKEAQFCAPDLPILSPFKNASNWHAQAEPENHFPNIFELMHNQFQFKPAQSKEEWLEKSLKLPDEIILAALEALGITDIIIDNNWTKRKQAIEILSLIAFNN